MTREALKDGCDLLNEPFGCCLDTCHHGLAVIQPKALKRVEWLLRVHNLCERLIAEHLPRNGSHAKERRLGA